MKNSKEMLNESPLKLQKRFCFFVFLKKKVINFKDKMIRGVLIEVGPLDDI